MQKTFFPLQNSIIIANKSSFSEYVGHSPAAAVLFAEIIKFAVSLFQNAVLAKLAKLCLPIVDILLCNRSMLTKKIHSRRNECQLYFNLWLHWFRICWLSNSRDNNNDMKWWIGGGSWWWSSADDGNGEINWNLSISHHVYPFSFLVLLPQQLGTLCLAICMANPSFSRHQ